MIVDKLWINLHSRFVSDETYVTDAKKLVEGEYE